MLRVCLNGQWQEVLQGRSVADLAQSLSTGTRRIAIERNGSIVPRSQWADCRLVTGDRIEVVSAVGGG